MPSHRDEESSVSGTSNRVIKRSADKQKKLDKIYQIYRQCRHELNKLENREIELDKVDLEEDERMFWKEKRLGSKLLQLHKYLVRKGVVVDDVQEERETLIITGTGSEFLDEMITDKINTADESSTELNLISISAEQLDDMLHELQKQHKFTACPSDPQARREFVIDVLSNVRKQVLHFRQKYNRHGLALCQGRACDAQEAGQGDDASELPYKATDVQNSSSALDHMSMQLKEAVHSGVLDVTEGEAQDSVWTCDHPDAEASDNEYVTDEDSDGDLMERSSHDDDQHSDVVQLDSSDDDTGAETALREEVQQQKGTKDGGGYSSDKAAESDDVVVLDDSDSDVIIED